MKKKTMSYVMSGALSISILSLSPSISAASPVVSKSQTASYKYGENNQIKPIRSFSDIILEQAEDFGIDPEGKDFETLAGEVRQAKLIRQADHLGIVTSGKDLETLRDDIRNAQRASKEKNE